MTTHEEHRRDLRQLAAEGADFFKRRDVKIRAARKDGMSLRDIGANIGLSYTQVDKIVKETRIVDGGGQ